jgi:KipI family sensor histidine kinase inhibitor
MAWNNVAYVSEDTVVLTLHDAENKNSTERLAFAINLLKRDRPSWLIDVTVGFGKLMVHYRPGSIDPKTLPQKLSGFLPPEGLNSELPSKQGLIELPVCYDPRVAPDIESVAEQLGLSVNEVSELHCQETYIVLAVGFALGFAYMGNLSARLNLPRKKTPATRVPAGGVAIAGSQTTIYPTETPGGWHLIGMCPKPLVERGEMIQLALPIGSRARFIPLSYSAYKAFEPSHS